VKSKLHVRVKAGSRKPGLTRNGDTVIVRVSARAIEGAANEAVRRAIAAWLGLGVSAVTIERGMSSQHKTLSLEGVDPEMLAAAVSALLTGD
jgi:uncharacterized protein